MPNETGACSGPITRRFSAIIYEEQTFWSSFPESHRMTSAPFNEQRRKSAVGQVCTGLPERLSRDSQEVSSSCLDPQEQSRFQMISSLPESHVRWFGGAQPRPPK